MPRILKLAKTEPENKLTEKTQPKSQLIYELKSFAHDRMAQAT